MPRNANKHFGPRARFNWGYHDARWDRERQIDRRAGGAFPLPKDKPYCDGYAAGHASGNDPEDRLSTNAWKARRP
jgi:hypothetical protein